MPGSGRRRYEHRDADPDYLALDPAPNPRRSDIRMICFLSLNYSMFCLSTLKKTELIIYNLLMYDEDSDPGP